MTERLDKLGRMLRLGDRVRLPSRREGRIRGFIGRADQERAVVMYAPCEDDGVWLRPQLLERFPAQAIPGRRRSVSSSGGASGQPARVPGAAALGTARR